MGKISRRDFLKAAAASAGAITLSTFLDACGRVLPTSFPPFEVSTSTPQQSTLDSSSPRVTTTSENSPTDTGIVQSPTDTPLPLPDMVVTRGGEPETLVRKALETLGGMDKFVFSRANVIIKPNICTANHPYEYASTTNPWVVGTLVKMCFEAGAASVKVIDSPFQGTRQKAYEVSGIQEQVEAAGGEMGSMPLYKYIPTQIPAGVFLKSTKVFEDILKADVVINVPIAKQHGSSGLTLGMKNLMGVIENRGALHLDLHQSIADLNSLIKPQLTVLDAVRILTANGPTGGNLADVQKRDTVIASRDVVAVDSLATSLFGMKPEDLDYIRFGTSMGLGRSDLQNLNIRVIELAA
jgi:uncharacterized protein (DUF362 family)/predicted small lipoprotein YifL